MTTPNNPQPRYLRQSAKEMPEEQRPTDPGPDDVDALPDGQLTPPIEADPFGVEAAAI